MKIFSILHRLVSVATALRKQRRAAMSWNMRRHLQTVCLASLANLAYAQPSIQIAAPPQEYVPFQVGVTFSRPYCLNETAAVSETEYKGNTLSITLTHLFQRGGCPVPQFITVPGLPRGVTTLKVSVTERGPLYGNVTNIAETIATQVVVLPVSESVTPATFWTGRYTPPFGGTPSRFVLTSSRFSAFGSEWDWLEAGDPETTAFTFKAFSFAASDKLPAALARLYSVPFPDPLTGVYWTIDSSSADALARSWSKPVTATQFAVGRFVNGVCPLGMSPIFQTFNPSVVTHRWTQSRSAYATMLANGYSGDGPVWCSPALRGE